MDKKQENSYAFIDGTNLHKGICELGWRLDYKRFRIWLADKYLVKGNCDAEMVLQTVSDMYEKNYDKAVIVTGDGDFACLASFLNSRSKLVAVLSPNREKAPLQDKTCMGTFSW